MSQTLKQMLDTYEKWLFADIEKGEQVDAAAPYGWTLAQYEELCELYITLVRQSASNYTMAKETTVHDAANVQNVQNLSIQ